MSQKTLQNESVGKATIVEYKTSDSKFHAFEKNAFTVHSNAGRKEGSAHWPEGAQLPHRLVIKKVGLSFM